jgi:hypothetical protein
MVVHVCNPSIWEAEAKEDCGFQASLDYKVRTCLKKSKPKQTTKTFENLMNSLFLEFSI